MFKQFHNIETAFRHVRLFTFVLIAACMSIVCFTILESYRMVTKAQERIYILASGKALEALAGERKDNIPVEARDHIKMFHFYFFQLDPDDKLIASHIGQALYLSDASAKKQFDNLSESGYYTGIISGNISQMVTMDSIVLGIDTYPFRFKYFGKQQIIRPTAILTRNLITEGFLRSVSRSDVNPHGFLIERWKIIDNHDLEIKNR
ncbi:conjugative transposon protein TraK [Chitinophaga varians]|uniref:Conjugative transposon protein TraK n=1 Tax=Chitinophaga varians TaxID=2202339 RepID=A0A847S9Y2_9BACT|nr:conjugative transposon protein TraK [Chitinophaga varians]NLR68521.1 conjugative transposon protein TraK [Chitinophaga varians]